MAWPGKNRQPSLGAFGESKPKKIAHQVTKHLPFPSLYISSINGPLLKHATQGPKRQLTKKKWCNNSRSLGSRKRGLQPQEELGEAFFEKDGNHPSWHSATGIQFGAVEKGILCPERSCPTYEFCRFFPVKEFGILGRKLDGSTSSGKDARVPTKPRRRWEKKVMKMMQNYINTIC